MTTYDLYYWPTIPGRGEFVRLVLEATHTPYRDVARLPEDQGGGTAAIFEILKAHGATMRPFAPPILTTPNLVLWQTAHICTTLAQRHNLMPSDPTRAHHTAALLLTLIDVVDEFHNTHHPVAIAYHYEDQQDEARRNAQAFVQKRLPRFFNYFEDVWRRNTTSDQHLVGEQLTVADLALFQVLEGFAYAFPNAFSQLASDMPGLLSVRDHVRQFPTLQNYFASDRHIAFNNHGIFRHYTELDCDP